ncbi:Nif11-like leader peptide family natural product precursor [Vulcanococcus limneticus Candia 3F8]|uniref:Nif11-like leader peptide family natural product precursor n=1 Tax=Vulcanococcus limneticus TaxID=2170428 RepID=UPI0020CC83FE|nr:Nif11-like leader peptide family natural product precursor [Vulcanococcus limneticus]MCP9793380.1 Nif11-like leader peptide family natural product precursor [Vulcanococcus limneticus MW73D5]MCP9895528.1 Nif11-like leader peptide family natural product precursor [Vulcanococcus limneticus Candia 3F8]MCP9898795.1 Nif11-like leader peptide family natural product precursor [Vulcanococcus limneticus Candia 3B3]
MSWSELERLVADAEVERDLRSVLHHCRSRRELILLARRMGYRISRLDLQRAQAEHQLAEHVGSARAGR